MHAFHSELAELTRFNARARGLLEATGVVKARHDLALDELHGLRAQLVPGLLAALFFFKSLCSACTSLGLFYCFAQIIIVLKLLRLGTRTAEFVNQIFARFH